MVAKSKAKMAEEALAERDRGAALAHIKLVRDELGEHRVTSAGGCGGPSVADLRELAARLVHDLALPRAIVQFYVLFDAANGGADLYARILPQGQTESLLSRTDPGALFKEALAFGVPAFKEAVRRTVPGMVEAIRLKGEIEGLRKELAERDRRDMGQRIRVGPFGWPM